MKKSRIVILLFIVTCIPLFSEQISKQNRELSLSLPDLTISSGLEYPLELNWDLLDTGIPITIIAGLPFPFIPWLSVDTDLSYTFLPVKADTSISLFSLSMGPRISIDINPRWTASFYTLAGGYYGFFNETATDNSYSPYDIQQGGSFYFSAGCGLDFYVSPFFSMGLRISSANYYFGIPEYGMEYIHTIRGGMGGSIHFDGFGRKVILDSVQFTDIFPALYKYYENHTAGTCIIRNAERFPVSDISISVFVRQFMNSPTQILLPSPLGAGDDREITLHVLFSDKVLGLTENNKVTAEIEMEYTLNVKKRRYKIFSPLRLYNRNAITWNDIKKAAAFVTATNTDILKFAKPVASFARIMEPVLLDENLKIAMAFFNALAQYGITYGSDPNEIPYQQASENTRLTDFLLFPVELLYYKSGDCDDLTILFCTLLESVGIETAFVFIPGHILPAFRTKMDINEIKTFFHNPGDFIITENKSVWIPVEITKIGDSFRDAWKTGAGLWSKSFNKGEAGFYPVHECWKVYEASDSPVIDTPLEVIAAHDVNEKYRDDLGNFIRDQLFPRIGELENRIAKNENVGKNTNLMGILYAQYGFYDQAENIFLTLIEKEENLAAILNLGNLYIIREMYDKALEQYNKAGEMDPGNEIVAMILKNLNELRIESHEQDVSRSKDTSEKARSLKWVTEGE